MSAGEVAFWQKVIPTEGCWHWIGHINRSGYGRMRLGGRPTLAHRASLMIVRGTAVPPGMEVDHLCRNRACVNPDHLEIVTHRINMSRGDCLPTLNLKKTHCPHGHELSEPRWTGKRFRRDCLECVRKNGRENMRRYRAAKHIDRPKEVRP